MKLLHSLFAGLLSLSLATPVFADNVIRIAVTGP